MTIGTTVIVSEVNLGTTVYGCYIESISGTTYSYFRNRFVENNTEETHFEQPQVKWKNDFWSGVGTHIKRAYIPYYNINGYALNGVCFKDMGLDPVNSPQSFNWRASQYVEGSQTYNNAKVFNFQRGPTEFFTPFYNDYTNNYQNHHIQITNTQLICDDHVHTFHGCEPCVICYVVKSTDAQINNALGSKIFFRENKNPSSPPKAGISWYYNEHNWLGTVTYTRQLWLSGNDFGYTSYKNTTVHMYKIKQGANFYVNIFSDWDNLSNVEKITDTDPLYKLYNDIVQTDGDTYTKEVLYTGLNQQGQPWITGSHDWFWNQHESRVNRMDTWICDTYHSSGSSGTWESWTGAFKLYVNVTTPIIGNQAMPHMTVGWSATYHFNADVYYSTVCLKGTILSDHAGLWQPNMFLNFLDSNGDPGANINYTSQAEGGARGGVFLRTDADLRNSNYIFLCTWDCG